MAELTLRDPLSSMEIKEIILQEIEKSLNRDSTLLNDITYAGFRANFQIKISFERSLTPPTMAWGKIDQTSTESGLTEPAGDAEVAGDYTAGAPNVERQEHNLPIPVLVQTPSGLVRKRVNIKRAGRKG